MISHMKLIDQTNEIKSQLFLPKNMIYYTNNYDTNSLQCIINPCTTEDCFTDFILQ